MHRRKESLGRDSIQRSVSGDWGKLTINISIVRNFKGSFELKIMFDYVSQAAFMYKKLSAGAEHFSGTSKQAAGLLANKNLINKLANYLHSCLQLSILKQD